MLGLLLLSAITTFQPPRPTVGDPITIDFAAPTEVVASPDYEVVSRSGKRVVIRTFVPHTITVTGRAADGPVSVMIPIHSVLKPDDKLEPAPLKPPKDEPWPRVPFVAVGAAAVAAIAAWSGVVVMARRRRPKPIVVVVPAEEFRSRVLALRRGTSMRWAQLADAVRAYLASVRADFGAELTTKELLAQVESLADLDAGSIEGAEVAGGPPAGQPPGRRRYDPAGALSQILRQGDLEKFSPWGAAPADFEDVLNRALEIPEWVEPAPVQALAQATDREVAA
jgi:hypothetical protein